MAGIFWQRVSQPCLFSNQVKQEEGPDVFDDDDELMDQGESEDED